MIVGDDAAKQSAGDSTADGLNYAAVAPSLRILIVDDEATLRDSCASVLRLDGYSVTVCGRYTEATEIINRCEHDILLLDLNLDGYSGMDLLRQCMAIKPDAIVIIMTGNPSIASSMHAISAGAYSYLPKPFSANHLQILIGRAAHGILTRRGNGDVRADFPDIESPVLIGNCDNFRKTVATARRAAQTDASIFISGESGTGKEQFANFIHAHSRRASQPMVAINCAALPEALLESEMFGHVNGAFTGATRDKPGLLETANGGTMFLDELTEMPATTQAKLLRVIQDGAVRRLGSNSVDAVVNVRFIAATNRDPREAVRTGALREDLYYRLRVVPLPIPSLRDRPADIPLLANHFLEHYWPRHREPDAARPKFTEAAIQSLQTRPWRGNVRELQNVIEHAVVLLQPGGEIYPEDLPVLDEEAGEGASETVDVFNENDSYYGARDRIVSRFERTYLKWLVSKASGNMSMAARIAGVDRTTLYRLMEKHSVQRDTVITIR